MKLCMFAAVLVLAGCATNAPPPAVAVGCGTQPGQSFETCVYALYGTYVSAESYAASLVANPNTPPAVVAAIRKADATTAPLMESGRHLLDAYRAAAAWAQPGQPPAPALAAAIANLQQWVGTAQPALTNLLSSTKANP